MNPRVRAPRLPDARLILVDDHDLARAGLRRVLFGAHGLEIVGEARTGQEALALCAGVRPDLVLMDVRLADMDGIAVTRSIRATLPTTQVILFTMYEADDYAQEAMRAGAAEYLLKGASRRELLQAIERVLRGRESPQDA